MRPIVADVPRSVLCVCLSVCLLATTESLQKRMNGSRCHLRYGLGLAKGTMYYEGPDIPRGGAICGHLPARCKVWGISGVRSTFSTLLDRIRSYAVSTVATCFYFFPLFRFSHTSKFNVTEERKTILATAEMWLTAAEKSVFDPEFKTVTSYHAAKRYAPADRGGSTSVCGRIRSPHISGGLA